jgi:hypothetical protein
MYFLGKTDISLPTDFFVDDVTFTVNYLTLVKRLSRALRGYRRNEPPTGTRGSRSGAGGTLRARCVCLLPNSCVSLLTDLRVIG